MVVAEDVIVVDAVLSSEVSGTPVALSGWAMAASSSSCCSKSKRVKVNDVTIFENVLFDLLRLLLMK